MSRGSAYSSLLPGYPVFLFEGFKALRGSNGPKRFCIDFFNDVNAFPRLISG